MAAYDCMAIAAERFRHGDRRSAVYQAGFLDALERKLNAKARPALCWQEGTVEFDAYFAGWDGGVLWAKVILRKAEEAAQ